MTIDTTPDGRQTADSLTGAAAKNPAVLKVENVIARHFHDGSERKALQDLFLAIKGKPEFEDEVMQQVTRFSHTIGMSLQQEDAELRRQARADYPAARRDLQAAFGKVHKTRAKSWADRFEAFWKEAFDKAWQLSPQKNGQPAAERNGSPRTR